MSARRDIALLPTTKAPPRDFPEAHVQRPGPPLAEPVDWFWLWDGYTAPRPKGRLLPMGTLDIVINLRDNHLCIYDRGAAEDRHLSGMLLCAAHSSYANHRDATSRVGDGRSLQAGAPSRSWTPRR